MRKDFGRAVLSYAKYYYDVELLLCNELGNFTPMLDRDDLSNFSWAINEKYVSGSGNITDAIDLFVEVYAEGCALFYLDRNTGEVLLAGQHVLGLITKSVEHFYAKN